MWAFGLCIAAIAFAEPECERLLSTVKEEQARVTELTRLNQELETKFEEHIRADFQRQSEGIIDQIHRNAALKIVFSKKQIQKKLAVQQNLADSAKNLYCSRCDKDDEPNETCD